MNVYLFYIVVPGTIDDYPGVYKRTVSFQNGVSSSLYAFTTSKNLAKTFWNTRKHSIFERKKEWMSETEYRQFAYTFGAYELSMELLMTKGVRDDKVVVSPMKIVLTGVEYDEITIDGPNAILQKIIDDSDFMIRDMFMPKIKEALNVIMDVDVLFNIIYPIETELVDYCYQFDEVAICITLFGNTFAKSKNGIGKGCFI